VAEAAATGQQGGQQGAPYVGADDALLASLEALVKAQVDTRLDAIAAGFGAYLAATIREHPDLTGAELVSREEVYNNLTSLLSANRARVEATITAAYTAAANAGRNRAAEEQGERHNPPPPARSSAYLTAVIATVAAAFAAALLDLADSVRAAYDAVTGTSTAVAAARVLATYAAVDRAVRRLRVRIRSAAAVAVHRGYTDAQADAWRSYAQALPSVQIRKQWRTTSANPCPSCRALDGTTLTLDAAFDPAAGESETVKRLPVFRDLQGPPRHPNCRCRLVYLPTATGARIQAASAAPPPDGTPSRISAADVRSMPSARFRSLLAFFSGLAARLRALLRGRSGGNGGRRA
jgi:hypothetical protein